MNWQTDEQKPVLERFHKIRCFTCSADIAKKSELQKSHMGHEAHYIDEKGEIND